MKYKKEPLIKRGDIYYADLRPVVGSEQGGVRPVLVIQNDVGNEFSPTVVVIPLTTKNKKELPMHYLIEKKKYNFLLNDSIALTEQPRSIDKERFKVYIGTLNKKDIDEIFIKCLENISNYKELY